MKKFDGMSILVAGATSGIGKATVKKLLSKGATVYAISHTEEQARSLEQDILPMKNYVFVGDLGNDESIQILHKKISHHAPSIDWLVYSAGVIDERERSSPISNDIMERTFAVNTFGAMNLVNLCTPMLTCGVVLVSSTAGLFGNPDFPIYSASKGALNSYGRSLARNFENRNLSCITICPGPTNTPMRRRIADDADKSQSPDVITSLIARIVSGESQYKNGDIIVVRDSAETLYEKS